MTAVRKLCQVRQNHISCPALLNLVAAFLLALTEWLRSVLLDDLGGRGELCPCNSP